MFLSFLLINLLIFSLLTTTTTLLPLGAILILRAITSALIISVSLGSWFAFILFLIYITGLLVLFGYIMAMRPNTYAGKRRILYISVPLAANLCLSLFNRNIPTLTPIKVKRTFELDVLRIFNQYNILIYWTIVVILLIALVIVVSLCYKSPKPLRLFL